MRKRQCEIVLALGLHLAPAAASAGVLYSDLGPGNTWIVNRDYTTNFDFMAAPFVTTGGGKLGESLIPLFSLNNPVSLGLYMDSNDEPGGWLESWSVVAPGLPGKFTTIQSVGNPLLSAETEYWLVFSLTAAQKDQLAWYENNQGLTGGIWLGNELNKLINFQSGTPAPAVQLKSIPEPSTWTLMLLGVAGLGVAGYRSSRKSVSIAA